VYTVNRSCLERLPGWGLLATFDSPKRGATVAVGDDGGRVVVQE